MANPPNLVLDTLTHDIVRDGGEDGGLHVLQGEAFAGAGNGALGDDRLASLLRLHLSRVVLRATLEEILAAPGVLDVLDAHVQALAHHAVTDGLGDLVGGRVKVDKCCCS